MSVARKKKEKKMTHGKEWKNPVWERPANERGCYVSMWTGYRWEFFAGPFRDQEIAEMAVVAWRCRYAVYDRDLFQFEMLDGQK